MQSYRIPCFAMPKGELAPISRWTGQSGKEYKKKPLAPEAAKGAGSRDDANLWNFSMAQEKKKSLITTRCVTKQGPEVFSKS